jgi:hypothetical protein
MQKENLAAQWRAFRSAKMSALGLSALPPEADMLIVGINVCYVPIADIDENQAQSLLMPFYDALEKADQALEAAWGSAELEKLLAAMLANQLLQAAQQAEEPT